MISDIFLKFGRVTYMAIFDCEWHSLTENVSNTSDQPGPRKMGHLTEHTNVDIRLTLKTGNIDLLYSPSVWSKRAENFLIRLRP